MNLAKIANILVRRGDGDFESCMEEVRNCQEELMLHIEDGNLMLAEDCIMDNLGLEPDYLDDLVDL
jgi:hypothetical protein